MWEIKHLANKIASASRNKNEGLNQCAHVREDALNCLCNLKGSSGKSSSSSVFNVDDYGLPQDLDESIVDDQSSVLLERESSSTACSKVQKTLEIKFFFLSRLKTRIKRKARRNM